jgi:hypothetical protein
MVKEIMEIGGGVTLNLEETRRLLMNLNPRHEFVHDFNPKRLHIDLPGIGMFRGCLEGNNVGASVDVKTPEQLTKLTEALAPIVKYSPEGNYCGHCNLYDQWCTHLKSPNTVEVEQGFDTWHRMWYPYGHEDGLRDLPATAKTKFQLRDRVIRQEDVFKADSPVLHGRIVRIYEQVVAAGRTRQRDFYPEMYDVLWNEKQHIGVGYLPDGLDPDPEWRKREVQ